MKTFDNRAFTPIPVPNPSREKSEDLAEKTGEPALQSSDNPAFRKGEEGK